MDADTRLVTVQFSLYNENVDQFAIYTLYIEFPVTGGVNVGSKNNIVRLFTVTTARSWSDIVLETIVALYFLGFLVNEVFQVLRHGLNALLATHNILHNANIFLYAGTWICRIAATYATIRQDELEWNASVYYGLQAAGSLRTLAVSFAAVNAFLVWFKLAHYLSALPQFALVTGTLYRAIKPCVSVRAWLNCDLRPTPACHSQICPRSSSSSLESCTSGE